MKSELLLLFAIFRVIHGTPIIGGEDVGEVKKFGNVRIVINPGTFPFLVLVKRDGHACSGVIIKRNAVLTAAHCVDPRPRATMSVWAGIIHRQLQIGHGQEVGVKDRSFFRQEQKPGARIYEDDIAILWLQSLLTIVKRQVEVAKLPPRNFDFENKDGFIAGWGMKNCGSQTFMLQKTTLTAISQGVCQTHFLHPITNKVICAISRNKLSTSSFGDSGSPFIVDGVLAGISSYGSVKEIKHANGRIERNCDATKPAVFTSVPAYIDWIQNELAKHPVKPKSPSPSRPDLNKTTKSPKPNKKPSNTKVTDV